MVRNQFFYTTGEDDDGVVVAKTNLFKVPVAQRSANPQAYSPYLFSFGPYNHAPSVLRDEQCCSASASSRLRDGHHLKKKAAEDLLEPADGLNQLKEKIKHHDSEIRTQYVQMGELESLHRHLANANDFASLLALDGVTMVAATLSHEKTAAGIHPITRSILSDAILLENQLPMIVLKCVVESLKPNIAYPPTLQEVVKWYVDRASPFPDTEQCDDVEAPQDGQMQEPILSFIYDRLTAVNTIIDIEEDSSSGGSRSGSIATLRIDDRPSLPTASELVRCGFTFWGSGMGHVKGIQIDRGTGNEIKMGMPIITVSDTTVRVLHNLLAYEATSRFPHEYDLASYVHFMDCLIDTADDVRVLVDAGIIKNSIGSHEELAAIWNKLCKSVSCGVTDQHTSIMKQVVELSKQKWRRWGTSFKEEYWEKQPWLLFSILAAIILFVLSLLQTIYTILAYK